MVAPVYRSGENGYTASTARPAAAHYTGKRLLGVGVVIGLLVLGVWFFHDRERPVPTTVQQVTQAVSRHMLLPTHEQPLLATVTDKSALKTPFLKEADNGDKILIYEQAKRVIIYRPSIDRIVDVGPVELSDIPKVTQ